MTNNINLADSKIPFTYQCNYLQYGGLDSFDDLMALFSSYGFYGVEVNIPDFTTISNVDLKTLLANHNLVMTRIATGYYAGQNDLYITSPDQSVRDAAVEACKRFLEYGSIFDDCGIILGFMKGPAGIDKEAAKERAINCLNQIMPTANDYGVRVVLESTNHYETSLAVTMADAVEIADAVGQGLDVLPDVYHMNIEEVDTPAVLEKYKDYYAAVHFSDNNRYLPGLGNIDFKSFYSNLLAMDYQGTIGWEGNWKWDVATDLGVCVPYMYNVIKSVAL